MRDLRFETERQNQGIEALPLEAHPVLTDPASSVTSLISTLEEIIRLQQELLSLLQREKKLIIDGERDELLRCLQEKETLLGCLRGLEQRRQAEVIPLQRQWG